MSTQTLQMSNDDVVNQGGEEISPQHPVHTSLLDTVRAKCRSGFAAVGFFSMLLNVLMLAAPIYMLQVFDRVLSSRSTDTLIFLTLAVVMALLALAGLESVRSRILAGIGAWLERTLSPALLDNIVTTSAKSGQSTGAQGLRDLQLVRSFLQGSALKALIDAPWTPLFVFVMFMLHPMLGFIALGGGLILLALAYLNDRVTRPGHLSGQTSANQAVDMAEAAARNADSVVAMGMHQNITNRWTKTNTHALGNLTASAKTGGDLSALSKLLRLCLQITSLGTGAWLVLGGNLTAGGMVAGSILLGRALAPIDQAIGSWRSAGAAFAAYKRIKAVVERPLKDDPMQLPTPEGRLQVEGLVYAHQGQMDPLLRNVSFSLEPGESLAIVGPTATGKTTLARLLVGTIKPLSGSVRIDGADVSTWPQRDLGRHIGYVPQDIELFAGTIRDNISRMGDGDPAAVIKAAQQAGVHEMILKLPQGYETNIGDGGASLSGGQRQRIALARALYGEPKIVLLDEPNANLDNEGDMALVQSMKSLAENKITTIIIAHRPSVLKHIDYSLVMQPGAAPEFGSREEMFTAISAPAPVARVVGGAL